MALSQLSASAVYNIVILCDMASICGIEVDLKFLEEVTLLNRCKDYPGGYYLSMKHNIICGAPNKIHNWKYRYFWVKINRASLVEGSRPIRHTWNGIVGGCLFFFLHIRENLILTFRFLQIVRQLVVHIEQTSFRTSRRFGNSHTLSFQQSLHLARTED